MPFLVHFELRRTPQMLRFFTVIFVIIHRAYCAEETETSNQTAVLVRRLSQRIEILKTDEFHHLGHLLNFLLFKFEKMLTNYRKHERLTPTVINFRETIFQSAKSKTSLEALMEQNNEKDVRDANERRLFLFEEKACSCMSLMFKQLKKDLLKFSNKKRASAIDIFISNFESGLVFVIKSYCEVLNQSFVKCEEITNSLLEFVSDDFMKRMSEFRNFKSNTDDFLTDSSFQDLCMNIYVDLIVFTYNFNHIVRDPSTETF